MTGRAALAALALSAPAAAEVPGRVSASVSAGGGWASDVFVGAGAGENAFVEVAPAARLDLALAPAWKVGALGDGRYGTFQPSGFTALAGRAGLQLRWLPGEPWETSLSASVERATYSQGAPLDAGLVASPTVTAVTEWALSPGGRLRAAGWEWRASAVLAWRDSSAQGQVARERITSAAAGASRPLGRRLDVAVAARLTRSHSDRADVAFWAGALSLGLGARVLEAGRLEGAVQVQEAEFDTYARETVLRLAVTAAHPLGDGVEVEAGWTLADNFSSDPARATASRQTVLLGLRGRSGILSW